MDTEFDVIVIGAGAGGLLTAARLAHLGYRTLVAERLEHLGGRASTRDIDGFKVNNGAIVIETGGITQQTFTEVGADFDIRMPDPPILYRVGGKDVDVTGGGWGFLLSRLTRHGAKVLSGLADARRDEGLPDGQLSTADWLARFTRNQAVHGVFRSMCGSVFAVGADELPARVFLTYFTRKSAFKTFGFCPQGTIGIWASLASAITGRAARSGCAARCNRSRWRTAWSPGPSSSGTATGNRSGPGSRSAMPGRRRPSGWLAPATCRPATPRRSAAPTGRAR
jgi:phytoene desaturase